MLVDLKGSNLNDLSRKKREDYFVQLRDLIHRKCVNVFSCKEFDIDAAKRFSVQY